MAVDTGYAVGNGVTAKGTRTNQEEPRSSIAPQGAENTPEVERGILDRDENPESLNESAARLTKTIRVAVDERTPLLPPICFNSETLILLAGITHNERTYVTWP